LINQSTIGLHPDQEEVKKLGIDLRIITQKTKSKTIFCHKWILMDTKLKMLKIRDMEQHMLIKGIIGCEVMPKEEIISFQLVSQVQRRQNCYLNNLMS